jgi:hypothetical protein
MMFCNFLPYGQEAPTIGALLGQGHFTKQNKAPMPPAGLLHGNSYRLVDGFIENSEIMCPYPQNFTL